MSLESETKNIEKAYLQARSTISTSQLSYKKIPISSSAKASLLNELTTSKYLTASPTELKEILDQTTIYYEWNLPFFSIQLWAIPDVQKTFDQWKSIFQRVLYRLETLRLYYEQKESKTMNPVVFTCVPIDIKRELPTSSRVCVKSEHINGGYTFIGLNQIYILRKEECPKVMLHEYLHQIQGNADQQWTGPILQELYQKWSISTERCSPDMLTCSTMLRPNEAIVEFWAWIHQIQFISLEYSIPWIVLWNAEYDFVMGQIKKLIEHQKECSLDQQWREETHSFSYHVLKGFFAWCLQTEHQIPVTLIYTIQNLLEKIRLKWTPYWNSLEMDRPMYQKRKKHTSMRMTLFGDF